MSDKIENESASKESLKIKKKPGRPRKMIKEESINKVDLVKKQEDAIQEQSPVKVDENKQTSTLEKVEERAPEPRSENPIEKEKEVTIIKEKAVEDLKAETKEAIRDERVSGIKLPENVEKLVNFMEETGGTVEDYVTLNKDYTKYDDKLLVREFYKKLDRILTMMKLAS